MTNFTKPWMTIKTDKVPGGGPRFQTNDLAQDPSLWLPLAQGQCRSSLC